MSSSTGNVRQEINTLRAEIKRHEYLYYVSAAPEISDQQFDGLMNRLKQLEALNPDLITPDSPTQRVGGEPLTGFTTIRHDPPMLSLANCYSFSELEEFHRRILELAKSSPIYVCELKIDGVAVKLVYKNRQLALGATRGNGQEGDDITANLKTIRSIPLSVPDFMPSDFEVRGEVYFPMGVKRAQAVC